MKISEPPHVAKWLLEHLHFGSANDALIGDLQEAFTLQSRSPAWYWRQAFIAITLAFSRDLRRHPWIVLRAVVVGLFVAYGAQMLGHEGLVRLYPELTPIVGSGFFVFAAWMANAFFCGIVSAWTVVLLHRNHGATVLFVFAVALVLWESFMHFYVNDFQSVNRASFALLFYLFALSGVFADGFLSHLGSQRKPTSLNQP